MRHRNDGSGRYQRDLKAACSGDMYDGVTGSPSPGSVIVASPIFSKLLGERQKSETFARAVGQAAEVGRFQVAGLYDPLSARYCPARASRFDQEATSADGSLALAQRSFCPRFAAATYSSEKNGSRGTRRSRDLHDVGVLAETAATATPPGEKVGAAHRRRRTPRCGSLSATRRLSLVCRACVRRRPYRRGPRSRRIVYPENLSKGQPVAHVWTAGAGRFWEGVPAKARRGG